MRHVVQGTLDWNRDLLFDLLAGIARRQRDDHHAGVGDVRIGFDLQLLERPESERGQPDAKDDRQQSMMEQRKGAVRRIGPASLTHQQHRPVDHDPIARHQALRDDDGASCRGPSDTSRRSNCPRACSTNTVVRRSSWITAPIGTVTTASRRARVADAREHLRLEQPRGLLQLGDDLRGPRVGIERARRHA